jgi:hypothetical protein
MEIRPGRRPTPRPDWPSTRRTTVPSKKFLKSAFGEISWALPSVENRQLRKSLLPRLKALVLMISDAFAKKPKFHF